MPKDPKLIKPDRKRPIKPDTVKKKESAVSKKKEPAVSKKKEPAVSKILKQTPNREALKNEKYRSGSTDRTNVSRVQDSSRTRQAKSVDRAPKDRQKIADTKDRNKSTIYKSAAEVKTKPSEKRTDGRKTIAATTPLTRDKYKSLTQDKNDVNKLKTSSSGREKRPYDSKKPSTSNSQGRKSLSNSGTSVVKTQGKRRESIDDRKHKLGSSHRSSISEEKTPSFVTVIDEEEAPSVRPGTSTIRKGPIAINDSENIPEPSAEDQENSKNTEKLPNSVAPSAGKENNVKEEEYNYEDDFEDYDSDFEEESDSDSVSEAESSKSSELENDEENAVSEAEMTTTPRKEEMDAAGLFLHPTIVKRTPPISTPTKSSGGRVSRQVLRMTERIQNYEELPKDDVSPAGSNMKTSRSFINFAGAKEEGQKKKVSNKILKRGMELLEIITLDKVSFDVFDMPPMKYDAYIRSFGKSNTKQVFIQTENTEDEEVETDEIEVRDKWTQHPPSDNFGVGGDMDLKSNAVDKNWESHFKTDAVKLNNFIQNVAPVVLALIAEDLPHLSMRQITEKRPDVPFSQGYYNLSALSFCKDAPVIYLCCSPLFENYLISVHGNMCTFPSTEILVEEKGVICVWNLFDISKPEFVLISNSQPSCSCFGPGNISTIVAGMVDGSVMLWDLTEPVSGHHQFQSGVGEIVLRSPTYNTAAVVGEEQHHGCVVSIQTAQYLSRSCVPDANQGISFGSTTDKRRTDLLKDGINNKGSSKTFHVLSLEDMGILNVWVVVEVQKLDPAGSEYDLGLSPGGKLRLIRSSTILLHSLNILSSDLLAGIRTFEFRMLPSDLNHILVTTDAGIVLHVTRHSRTASPKYFVYDAGPSVEIRSIDCSPHSDSLFLVGSSDGSVRLHNIKSSRPVMVWPQAAGGEPVLLVQWSTHQPAMFYVLDTISHMYVWDLCKKTTMPSQTCHFDGPRVTWFAVNSRVHLQSETDCPSLMAIAKENGEIEVHALKQQVDVISEAEYKRQILFMQSL